MFQPPYEENKGFILLVNVLIIGIVSVLIGGLIMLLSLYSLKNSQVYVSKNQSLSINHACAEEALYLIRQNPSYSGQANLTIGGLTCSYRVDNLGGVNRQVTTSSTVRNVVSKTRLLLTVSSSSTINISSWQEYP